MCAVCTCCGMSAAIWVDVFQCCVLFLVSILLVSLPVRTQVCSFAQSCVHLDSMVVLHRPRLVVPPTFNEIPERDIWGRLC